MTYVVIIKNYKHWRKNEVIDMNDSWAFKFIQRGVVVRISKEVFDFMCVEKWEREVRMKHGEDKVKYCKAIKKMIGE